MPDPRQPPVQGPTLKTPSDAFGPFVNRGQAAQKAVDAEIVKHPQPPNYHQLVEAAHRVIERREDETEGAVERLTEALDMLEQVLGDGRERAIITGPGEGSLFQEVKCGDRQRGRT